MNTYCIQVQVDLKTETPPILNRTLFTYTCYGEDAKLLLRLGQVNRPVGELCRPRVRMAYNIAEGKLYVITGTLTFDKGTQVVQLVDKYKMLDIAKVLSAQGWGGNIAVDNGAFPSEYLSSFFTSKNLTPSWHYAYQVAGSQDEQTGLWNGAIGMVSYIIWEH